MTATTGKIAYLEGIRGVAALLVFFHHFLLAFYPAYYTYNINESHLGGWEIRYGQSLLSVLSNGNFYVRIFFVLSGYVLSRKYMQYREFSILVSGAQRRFVRLYVPVASAIILSFVLMQTGLFYNIPVSAISHSEWWFGNMWQLQEPVKRLLISLTYSTMFQGDGLFDTTMRTMSAEFYGSMLVFAFLALTHYTRNRFTMLVLLLLYLCCTGQHMYATFIFGISLNYIEQWRLAAHKYLTGAVVAVLLPVSLVFGAYPPDIAPGTFFSFFPQAVLTHFEWFHVIGAFFLVVSFVLSPALQRLISLRFFRFLGLISFSLYLLHPLLIGSFGSYLFLRIFGSLGYNHAVAVVFLAVTAMCFGLSWLMAKYIDMPSMKLSRYIYDRWGRKEQVAAK